MAVTRVDRDVVYVLNHCARFLARDSTDRRHDFGQFAEDDQRAAVSEAWRFPIIDSHFDGVSVEDSYRYNDVTFVFAGGEHPVTSVAVVGTFGALHEPVPLQPLQFLGEDTGYFAVTIRVPKGQVHRYKFSVDEQWTVDPVNPQREKADSGEVWSRFFTDSCYVPLELTRRERDVLSRLVAHLLPFRLPENRVFVQRVYEQHDRDEQYPLIYRLDEEVGVVNYIDKLLARAEQHHADDYHVCLGLIDGLLRERFGGLDPLMLPLGAYKQLYDEMKQAADQDKAVPGWDTSRYGDPYHFLLLLRRHAMTGAFAHPRSGGNSGAAGWVYLESRFRDEQDQTLFDWRRAIEAPLGRSTEYRG
jgi:hypothetical protein